jgi:hypothetical protein
MMKTQDRRSAVCISLVLLFGPCCTYCNAFSLIAHHGSIGGLAMTRTFQSSVDDNGETTSASASSSMTPPASAGVYDCTLPPELSQVERLKRQLFELGASFDRGFGASPRARDQADSVIAQLQPFNPEPQAARGIDGKNTGNNNDNDEDGSSSSSTNTAAVPLKGSWRMIWTTASDVLLLSASPAFCVGAIHQVFEPPVVTNVIDFSPRAQLLLPPNLVPNTLLRAKVKTRSSSRRRSSKSNTDDGDLLPNRVGLVFEAVQLQPLQVLGMDIDVFPQIGFDLPKIPMLLPDSLLPAGMLDGPDSPGYFDVLFLDYELLVIRQNAPGGLFAFVKVDSIDA